MMLAKLDSYMPKNHLIPCTKINSKWIKDLNVRPETIKLLEENKVSTLSDVGLSSVYVYIHVSSGKANKSKINKWGYIKLKTFCIAKSYPDGKESACLFRKHRRHEFNPWIGTIPWRKKWQLLQYSHLKNPMDTGAWQATVHEVTKSQTWLSNWAHRKGNYQRNNTYWIGEDICKWYIW